MCHKSHLVLTFKSKVQSYCCESQASKVKSAESNVIINAFIGHCINLKPNISIYINQLLTNITRQLSRLALLSLNYHYSQMLAFLQRQHLTKTVQSQSSPLSGGLRWRRKLTVGVFVSPICWAADLHYLCSLLQSVIRDIILKAKLPTSVPHFWVVIHLWGSTICCCKHLSPTETHTTQTLWWQCVSVKSIWIETSALRAGQCRQQTQRFSAL